MNNMDMHQDNNDNMYNNKQIQILSDRLNIVEERNANASAIISLICFIGWLLLNILVFILNILFDNIAYMGMTTFAELIGIVGLVNILVTRSKYPSNKLGKVVMWIYIIGAIITGILLVIAILFMLFIFGYMINSGMF